LSPARGQQFPERHRGENADEASQPQGGFVGKKSLNHVFRPKRLDELESSSHNSIVSLNDLRFH
jgi:hypothetical protein